MVEKDKNKVVTNNEFTYKHNYEETFLRNVVISFSKFMNDLLEYEEIRGGQKSIKKVPCFYSATLDQQFATDFYLDSHLYFSDGTAQIEGNYKSIPSGVFTIRDSGVNNSQLSGGYERMEFIREYETEYGVEQKTVSANVAMYPEEFSVTLEIKCASETERLKIYDCIIEKLYKVRKIYFKYRGFRKIPLSIQFPESPGADRQFTFRTNSQDKLLLLKVDLKLFTHRPIIDETTVMKKAERVSHFITKTEVDE